MSLHKKLNQKPLESKKFIGSLIGLGCTMFMWLTTAVLMVFEVSLAAQFVSLATIGMAAVGAIVSTLITGQSAVDFKTIGMVGSETKNENTDYNKEVKVEKDEHVFIQGDNGPELKPYYPVAPHDADYEQ